MTRLESGAADVLAWTREAAAERLLVLVSFVGETRTVDLAGIAPGTSWTPRVGTRREPSAPSDHGRLELAPDEAVILESVER